MKPGELKIDQKIGEQAIDLNRYSDDYVKVIGMIMDDLLLQAAQQGFLKKEVRGLYDMLVPPEELVDAQRIMQHVRGPEFLLTLWLAQILASYFEDLKAPFDAGSSISKDPVIPTPIHRPNGTVYTNTSSSVQHMVAMMTKGDIIKEIVRVIQRAGNVRF